MVKRFPNSSHIYESLAIDKHQALSCQYIVCKFIEMKLCELVELLILLFSYFNLGADKNGCALSVDAAMSRFMVEPVNPVSIPHADVFICPYSIYVYL